MVGANDDHVSSYKWDWLVKHRNKAAVSMFEQEKQELMDPYVTEQYQCRFDTKNVQIYILGL